MKKFIWLGAFVLALFILVSFATSYYTDYLWYRSMDAVQVFLTPFVAELVLKAVLLVLGFVFILLNLLPMAGVFGVQRLRVVGDVEVQRHFALGKGILTVISLAISLFWVWALPALWDRVLLFINAQPTGQVDPILGRDISYYLFSYPLFTLLSGAFIGLLLLTAVAVTSGYALGGALRLATGKPAVSGRALKHFSLLLALFLLWFAVNRQLAMAGMLVSPSQSLFGAGYTDVNIRLPLFRLMQIVAVGLAVVMLANVRISKARLFIAAPAVLVIIAMAGGLYAAIIQQFVVGPNQLVRETPYISHHIAATRDAYGLGTLEQVEYPIERQPASAEVLAKNQRTIDNIRLLDYRPLKQHYHQNQSLRLYYEFHDIDIDRYRVGDEYHQVMLAVRELNVEALPDQAQTLINRHFKYTHGYGVVMSPVNRITANGHPTYFFRDIPVHSELDIALERPEVYFGELTNQFVVVNTATGEFGYTGDQERIVHYQGSDGVELTPFRRLLYALRFQKPILLLSDEITADSRILYNRNIVQRINKVAPFLKLDSDPYPVVANGQIYWLVDAYTTSGYYPYSEPTGRINYVRNSAKVVVDAYNGTVGIYRFDETDPLLGAWSQVFPGLVRDRSDFPEYLENHIRYPLDYFALQANILRTYHMTNPRDFYNREDVWEVAVEKYAGREVPVEPYYVTMQLPGQQQAEFVLKLPFTPYNRNNMVGWLAAGNDGDNYGRLMLYHFPRGELVEGPSQIEAYIDQDPYISQQISLWDQGGSEVVRGNLLTIPVNGSILYVEPLYILAQTRSVPELRQVIVYFNDVLVMEPTLELALKRVFGVLAGDEPRIPDPGQPGLDRDLRELVAVISQTYADMERAAREGRWAEYGQYLEELGRLLKQLEAELDQPAESEN